PRQVRVAAHDDGRGDRVGQHPVDALRDPGRLAATAADGCVHGDLQLLHRDPRDRGVARVRVGHGAPARQQPVGGGRRGRHLPGRNLRGARLAGAAGLRTSNVRINEAGTYLFADVAIERTAAPGTRTLQVTTSDGVAPAPFELWAPLPREGRFQGFSSEDLVY